MHFACSHCLQPHRQCSRQPPWARRWTQTNLLPPSGLVAKSWPRHMPTDRIVHATCCHHLQVRTSSWLLCACVCKCIACSICAHFVRDTHCSVKSGSRLASPTSCFVRCVSGCRGSNARCSHCVTPPASTPWNFSGKVYETSTHGHVQACRRDPTPWSLVQQWRGTLRRSRPLLRPKRLRQPRLQPHDRLPAAPLRAQTGGVGATEGPLGAPNLRHRSSHSSHSNHSSKLAASSAVDVEQLRHPHPTRMPALLLLALAQVAAAGPALAAPVLVVSRHSKYNNKRPAAGVRQLRGLRGESGNKAQAQLQARQRQAARAVKPPPRRHREDAEVLAAVEAGAAQAAVRHHGHANHDVEHPRRRQRQRLGQRGSEVAGARPRTGILRPPKRSEPGGWHTLTACWATNLTMQLHQRKAFKFRSKLVLATSTNVLVEEREHGL